MDLNKDYLLEILKDKYAKSIDEILVLNTLVLQKEDECNSLVKKVDELESEKATLIDKVKQLEGLLEKETKPEEKE